jgi:hypothetical protein
MPSTGAVGMAVPSAVPQFMQKRAALGFRVPQLGHSRPNSIPHLAQVVAAS